MKKIALALFVFSSFAVSAQEDCFEIPNLSTSEVMELNDDSSYPGGSTILSDGYIDIIIPNDGFGIYPSDGTDLIDANSTDGISFINQLDLDVSAAPYSCKELSFILLYNGIAVDGDTVFLGSWDLPALPYAGSGFTVDTISAENYLITGDFDVVHIFGSTSILNDLCMTSCETDPSSCFEIPNLSFSEVAELNDDSVYPAGSTILSDGYIDIIVPNDGFGIYPSDGTDVIDVNPTDGIAFINQLDLDVSAAPYSCKELSFSLIYNGIAVDEDTISLGSWDLPALPYAGSGFTVDTTSAENYVITGDFDVVHIFGSTSILNDICMASCDVVSTKEIGEEPTDLVAYPNPTSGEIHLSFSKQASRMIVILDATGNRLQEFNTDELEVEMDLSELAAGLYYLLAVDGDEKLLRKIVKK